MFLVSGLWILTSQIAPAIIDENQNGISDLWEKQYNSGALIGNLDLQADPDGDGWTNAQEAAAGTNPFAANSPDGILRPSTVHTPAVWGDANNDGIPDIITPEAITVRWVAREGKQQTLEMSFDLTPGSWIMIGTPFIGNGNQENYSFKTDDSDKKFWRVAVTDTDSDSDGLTDTEEFTLGLNPSNPETLSGIPDLWLAANFSDIILTNGVSAIDPNADPDGDGASNLEELLAGTNLNIADASTARRWVAVHGNGAKDEVITRTATLTIPAGTSALLIVAIASEEYPIYTGDSSEFNDLLEWTATPSQGAPIHGSINVNERHNDWEVDLASGTSLPGLPSPVHIEKTQMLTAPPGSDLTINVSVSAKNISDDQLPSHVAVGIVPVDITVAFGLGPEPLGEETSRELLEEYLDTIKVSRTGDTWLVKHTDAQGVEKFHGVEIVTTKEKLIDTLKRSGQKIVFDGHSNFGLGPNFSGKVTHKTIADFTHFGVGQTSIPKSYRGAGTEADVVQFTNGDGTTLPTNPEDLAAIDRIQSEGWAYLKLEAEQIIEEPKNHQITELEIERFKNLQGVAPESTFTKQGSGFNNEWHFDNPEGSRRLIVQAPSTDLPTLGYAKFFYNACITGRDYIESFKHGDFFYTKDSCRVEKATKIFVQGIVEDQSSDQILTKLNQNGVGNNPGQSSQIYGHKTF